MKGLSESLKIMFEKINGAIAHIFFMKYGNQNAFTLTDCFLQCQPAGQERRLQMFNLTV